MEITINMLRINTRFEWSHIIDRNGEEFQYQKGMDYVDEDGNLLYTVREGWTADDGEHVYPEYVLWDAPILEIYGTRYSDGIVVKVNL